MVPKKVLWRPLRPYLLRFLLVISVIKFCLFFIELFIEYFFLPTGFMVVEMTINQGSVIAGLKTLVTHCLT